MNRFFEEYTPPLSVNHILRTRFLTRLDDLKEIASKLFPDVHAYQIQALAEKYRKLDEMADEMRELAQIEPPVAKWQLDFEGGQVEGRVESSGFALKQKMRAYSILLNEARRGEWRIAEGKFVHPPSLVDRSPHRAVLREMVHEIPREFRRLNHT